MLGQQAGPAAATVASDKEFLGCIAMGLTLVCFLFGVDFPLFHAVLLL